MWANLNSLFFVLIDKKYNKRYNYDGREAKEMYEEKRFLSAKEILDKDFKIDPKGYRPQEVDAFLDLIIKDYVDFENTTKRLVSEIKALESDNSKLRAEVRNLKASLEIANSNKGVTNVDLLKRISDLEKVVYGEE